MFKELGHRVMWAFRILGSESYVIATEKYAVCNVNVMDPYKMSTIISVSAQRTAIEELRDKLNGLIEQHDEATALLERK